jgi:glycosyltransferase involved in cell wall biosynthesis
MPGGKIVLLNGSYAASLINFRGPFIAAMIARGHRVHVTAPEIAPEIAGQLHALGAVCHEVTLERTGLNPLRDLAYCFELWGLVRRIRPDLVVGYTVKPNIWGSVAAWLGGIRSASIVTGLGYAFIPGEGLKRKLVQRAMRGLYRLASSMNEHVVFQNPDDRADFVAAGCLTYPAKAAMINGSGVDIDAFALSPLPEGPVFLMIARLLVSKGVREYAEAALMLKRSRPSYRFLLAGFLDEGHDGIAAEELDKWVAGGVEFVGSLDDVRPVLREASVYVLPSYREGTPRTVLEAMAMGRAIITTDAPGCRETVEQGVNGLLAAVRSAEAVAAAMQILGEDDMLRTAMGVRSRAMAETKYAVTAVNASLMAILDL